jgi:hypothetical protein
VTLTIDACQRHEFRYINASADCEGRHSINFEIGLASRRLETAFFHPGWTFVHTFSADASETT